MELKTDNIYFVYDISAEPYSAEERIREDLWKTLMHNAVEPGQASAPGLGFFADECLLFAKILRKPKLSELRRDQGDEEDDEDPRMGSQTPRIRARTHGPLSTPHNSNPPSSHIGLVYVYAGPANTQSGEANVGIIIHPDMQHHGYAREAVELALRWAFEELKFHRVQAAIFDTPCKDRVLRLFAGLGFSHEGTRRRAVYQPNGEGVVGMWRDVTYLAMLDTDWVLRGAVRENGKGAKQPAMTLWDEMFARHAREREQLLKWEEKHGRIRRSASTETLR
ncbi:hypothetical protein HYDPIDRAFT_96549, partial [Hydnomerulius pinastri MD-312]